MSKYVVALYIRLSVNDKISESLSIENQKSLLNTYVSSMEEYKNAEIIEFIDNGYSGTNFERPAVQEILDLVQSNKIDCLIVKDFSRFGRNILEVGYFTEKIFPLFNVRFISISDNFDSNRNKSDTGGIGVAFKYLVNEQYSKDLSRKVKSAVYTKMKNGEYKPSFTPFGYKKDMNGKLEIDEETGEIVKLIFKLVMEVDRITDVPKALNEKNIPTPSRYKKKNDIKLHSNAKSIQLWTVQSVKKILSNEVYIGTFIGKRYVTNEVGGACVPNYNKDEYIKIENNHPKIIDEDTFYKVQQLIVKGNKKPYVKNDYPLRSKLICGVCNHALVRVNKVKTFKCKYTRNVEGYSCKGLKILESELEDAVFTIIKKQVEVVLGLGDKKEDVANLHTLKQKQCEEEIISIEKEKMKLYEKFIRDEISMEKYKYSKIVLNNKQNEYEVILKTILKEKDMGKPKDYIVELIEKMILENKLSRDVVDFFIDNIMVYPNNKIEVMWKFGSLKKDR